MLDKRYDPHQVEQGKYDKWKEAGYFTAGDKSKQPFSIVIPPPNVTGKLHLGHAWDTTIQDIIARYKKMCGYDVCYLPGMDHAGIATQAKVMDKLSKSGIDVTKISREFFLQKAWEWKDEYALNIHEQWKKMGLALDYSKERFTLDEGLNKAVTKVPDKKNNKPYSVSSPKTSSSYRTIPIPNFLLDDLKQLYDDSTRYYKFNDEWYVFGDVDPMPETTLRDRKTKNAFKAGVKDIRVHDFRHSCASLLIDSGANITLVAKYLGHSKIDETLNTYSHMYQNRLENIVQIIEVQNSRMIDSKHINQLTESKEIEYIEYDYDDSSNLENEKEDDFSL